MSSDDKTMLCFFGGVTILVFALIVSVTTYQILALPHGKQTSDRLDKLEKRVEQLIDIEYSRSLNRIGREIHVESTK